MFHQSCVAFPVAPLSRRHPQRPTVFQCFPANSKAKSYSGSGSCRPCAIDSTLPVIFITTQGIDLAVTCGHERLHTILVTTNSEERVQQGSTTKSEKCAVRWLRKHTFLSFEPFRFFFYVRDVFSVTKMCSDISTHKDQTRGSYGSSDGSTAEGLLHNSFVLYLRQKYRKQFPLCDVALTLIASGIATWRPLRLRFGCGKRNASDSYTTPGSKGPTATQTNYAKSVLVVSEPIDLDPTAATQTVFSNSRLWQKKHLLLGMVPLVLFFSVQLLEHRLERSSRTFGPTNVVVRWGSGAVRKFSFQCFAFLQSHGLDITRGWREPP